MPAWLYHTDVKLIDVASGHKTTSVMMMMMDDESMKLMFAHFINEREYV